ncbi:hypothetical protein D3C71_878440 [compost metagenome]
MPLIFLLYFSIKLLKLVNKSERSNKSMGFSQVDYLLVHLYITNSHIIKTNLKRFTSNIRLWLVVVKNNVVLN